MRVEQGVELARRRGMQTNVVRIGIIRAGILSALGLDARCRSELDSLLDGTAVDLYEAQVLLLQSDLALRRGETGPVSGWLRRAEGILAVRSVRDEQVVACRLQARLEWAGGHCEAALARVGTAAAEARELGLAWLATEAEVARAEMLLDSGRDQEAARAAGEGEAGALDLGLPEAAWRFERVLGRLALRHGDSPEAVRRYEACLCILRDMTSELGPELADAYLTRPDRLRVFDELAEVRAAAEARD